MKNKIKIKTDSPCCEYLLKLEIDWFDLGENKLIMPVIGGKDRDMYRVQYCPSCGKYIRNIIIKK